MNPLLIKPVVLAIVIAVSSAVSFGVGWAVENWRKGAELEKLRGENTLLSTASGKCELDVKNARAAMLALTAEAEERAKQAEDAMKQVQPKVETRSAIITKIKTMPVIAPDAQCEAIKQEQIDYVAWRRGL